jgi:hypothetical protein
VWSRPIYAEASFTGGLDGRGCEACGRTSHPASYEVSFVGPAYYKSTLDPVDNDHEENSDGDSDEVSVNSKGQEIPKQNVTWAVGKYEVSHSNHRKRLITIHMLTSSQDL